MSGKVRVKGYTRSYPSRKKNSGCPISILLTVLPIIAAALVFHHFLV